MIVKPLAALAIVAAVLLLYWPVQEFGFINFDDPLYVSDNPSITQGLTRSSISWAFSSLHASNWHPVTWLSHILDVQLFGLKAGKHHRTNLILHALNALLLFLFLARSTGCQRRSALVALLFAVHPMHVESVAWISERKDVLSLFFMLLCLLAYRRYTAARNGFFYVSSLLCYGLGLLSKPMLVTLPILLLLLDIWPWAGGQKSEILLNLRLHNRATVFRPTLPFFLIAFASGLMTIWAQNDSGALKTIAHFPLLLRCENAIVSTGSYLLKSLWPHPLLLPYPYPEHISSAALLGTSTILILCSLLAVSSVTKRPYFFVGWFWFLMTLLPVIGIIQVGEQAMADRYTYLPHIGLFICLVWGGFDLAKTVRWGRVLFALAATTCLIGLAQLSRQQLQHWRSSITLFRHAITHSQDNYTAHNYLALALAEQGKTTEAEEHYRQALASKPDYVEALNNYAIALAQENRFTEGLEQAAKALRLAPKNARIHNNLGNILLAQEHLDEALSHYQSAVTLDPRYPNALYNLAGCLEKLERFDEAINFYQKALALQKNFPEAYNGLGVALARKGALQSALSAFQKAIALKPGYGQAEKNLIHAQKLLGEPIKK